MKTNTKYTTTNLTNLNQLAGMLDCSLARYLSNARPWCRRPYLLLGAITRRLAHEHERYAGAIVGLLQARRYNVNGYTFPMEFTYYNDLSFEYLAPRVLDNQRRLIALAKTVATHLASGRDHEAQRLVEKLLASLREYAALMEELLAPHRLATAARLTDRPAVKASRRSHQDARQPDANSAQVQTAA
jgi:hypothetical protein